MITFACWKCKTAVNAADDAAGRLVECGGCGVSCTVPSTSSVVSQVAVVDAATPPASSATPDEEPRPLAAPLTAAKAMPAGPQEPRRLAPIVVSVASLMILVVVGALAWLILGPRGGGLGA